MSMFPIKFVIISSRFLLDPEKILNLPCGEYVKGSSIYFCSENKDNGSDGLSHKAVPFNVRDGMGIRDILDILGIKCAIMIESLNLKPIQHIKDEKAFNGLCFDGIKTGNSSAIQRRFEMLKIAYFHETSDKIRTIVQFCQENCWPLENVAVLGEDLTEASFSGEKPGLLLKLGPISEQNPHPVRSWIDDYVNRDPGLLNRVLSSFRTIGNHEIDVSKIRPEAKKIRVLICDIDGTCTNGVKFFAEGERDLQWKCFSLKDIEAIKIWQKKGNFVFVITGDRQTPILQEFVDHANIPQEYVFTEAKNCKTGKLYEICQKHSFAMGEIAYIGDDINDLGIMECLIGENGMAACPGDASSFIQKINHIKRLKSKGGHGAVAEFIEEIHEINAGGVRP